jgi:hypothetical protein
LSRRDVRRGLEDLRETLGCYGKADRVSAGEIVEFEGV